MVLFFFPLNDEKVHALIKQLDPYASEVRKMVHRSHLSREEKVDLCWAMIESGVEALSPAARDEDVGEREVKQEKHVKGASAVASLVLDDGEVLSDGELSGEEKDSSECVQVVKRRMLHHSVSNENEEDAEFGLVFAQRADVCDVEKLNAESTRLSLVKLEADSDLQSRINLTDISRVCYMIEAAGGERIQGKNRHKFVVDSHFVCSCELGER
jgi:hypothetical protein